MNPSQPEADLWPEPPDALPCYTESLASVDVCDDGPGDPTVRPAPPNIPLGWYPQVSLPGPKPPAGPPSERKL